MLSNESPPAVEVSPVRLPSQGVCYGLEVLSSVSFEYLRTGSGNPVVVSEENNIDFLRDRSVAQQWDEIPGKRARTTLFGGPDSFAVRVGDSQWFEVETTGPRITMSPSPEPRRREMMLFSTPAALLIASQGWLALHAAAIEISGRAILIVAQSTGGKTTTAAAMHAAGYRVLADDFSGCITSDDPAVLPGPAVLRLRKDAAQMLDLSQTYVAYEDRGKVHHAVEPVIRGSGASVPLHGIVLLQSSDDRPHLQPQSGLSAVQSLWPMSFFLPTEADRTRCFQGLADLVSRVPCWNLFRRQSPDMLAPTVTLIESLAESS